MSKLTWEENVNRTTPTAYKHFCTTLTDAITQRLSPPPRLDVPAWANANRIIDSAAGPEAGPYRWQRAPYQKAMLEAAGDPNVGRVVLMMAVQTGKTIVMENIIAYYIANDPSPILVVMPDNGESKKWSQTKLEPMIAASPVLSDLIKQGRDSGNTQLKKVFPGGYIMMVGAQSEAAFRSLSIRILLLDEVDAYPEEVADTDVIKLARNRISNWWNKKEIMSSTPTYKDLSTIDKNIEKSDYRRFYIPCPHCNQYQIIKWASIRYKDKKGEDAPHTARFACQFTKELIADDDWLTDNHYYCPPNSKLDLKKIRRKLKVCGKESTEAKKKWMLDNGEWVAKYPEKAVDAVGFHLPAMYSPWISWKELVDEWIDIKTPYERKAFVNSRLAEAWEDLSERLDVHHLADRAEQYDADVVVEENGVIRLMRHGCPTGVGIIVGGIDVQEQGRLEVANWGFGIGEEWWHLRSEIFFGDVRKDAVYQALAEYMRHVSFPNANGAEVYCKAWCIDSGNMTDRVYRFVAAMKAEGHNIMAIKGASNVDAPPIPSKPSINRSRNVELYHLGVNQIKNMLVPRMKFDPPGQGTMHLRLGTTVEFLEQLTSERRIVKRERYTNKPQYRWVKKNSHVRNEQFDMMIYAYGAYLLSSPTIAVEMPELVQRVASAIPDEDEQSTETQPKQEQMGHSVIRPKPKSDAIFKDKWYSGFNR